MQLSKQQRQQISQVLDDAALHSRVIRDAALFDFRIGVALSLYFGAKPDRVGPLNQLIIDEISFGRKINILSRLPLKRSYKSLECIPVMRRVLRIRNFIAHTHFTDDRHKLFNDTDAMSLLMNYPEYYRKQVASAKNQIDRLTGSREFLR